MWSPPRVARAAALLAAWTAIGCGPTSMAAAPNNPGALAPEGTSAPPSNDPPAPRSACATSKDPLHPTVRGGAVISDEGRAALAKGAAGGGVVLVRYADCKVEVLRACTSKIGYVYTALASSATSDATGQLLAVEVPSHVDGACDAATHWVRAITLGPSRALRADAPSDAPPALERPVDPSPDAPAKPEIDCAGRVFSSAGESASAGCGEPIAIDVAPIERVEGAPPGDVFVVGFGADLAGAAGDGPRLRARYLRDRAALDGLLARPDDDLGRAVKAAYEREFRAVYAPREEALRVALGSEWKPLPTSVAERAPEPPPPPRALGAFRVVADGGLDGAQLSYVGAGSGAVLAGGYAGLTLSLPQVPVPGVGLSLRARYAAGPDLSRFQIGAGVQFFADVASGGSGVTIGLHGSYGYLLSANCDDRDADRGCAELFDIVGSSDGGGDVRASVDYEYLLGDYLILTAGGDVGFAFYPYTRANDEGDVAKGLAFGLHAGAGFRL